MPSLFDPLGVPTEDEVPPQLRGALAQTTAPATRGLPVGPIVPASPLDLFTRKPFTAPDVSSGGQHELAPVEHARFPEIRVDNSMAQQADQQLQSLLPGLANFGKKKEESVEELLNRIKIATAQQQTTDKGKWATESSMPEVSSDRQDYYRNTSGFESSDNPNAVNKFYAPDKAAAGLFQFMPSTVASLRAQNPDLANQLDAKWRTDKRQQLLLMNAYTDISDTLIKQITGKEPTNDQRYLMHLFGHGTGAKILKNPTLDIEAFFPSEEAFKEAVRVNPGVITYGMTGNDFLKWAAPIFGRKHDK